MSKVGLSKKQPGWRRAAPALALLSAVLMSGCTAIRHDSITVGSVPDDYRTNHPIVVGEQRQVVDIPVGATDRRMTDHAAHRARRVSWPAMITMPHRPWW